MKALTIREPYVSPIALGLKHYETRSWGTAYRGPILIHTAKAVLPDPVEGMEHLFPLGCIVLRADITDCIRMDEAFIAGLDETEKSLGFYSEGRYAWKLENVREVEPVKASGKLGLWEFEA